MRAASGAHYDHAAILCQNVFGVDPRSQASPRGVITTYIAVCLGGVLAAGASIVYVEV